MDNRILNAGKQVLIDRLKPIGRHDELLTLVAVYCVRLLLTERTSSTEDWWSSWCMEDSATQHKNC